MQRAFQIQGDRLWMRESGLSGQHHEAFHGGKLTEHQNAKLVISGELLDIFVTTIFPCEIVEIVAIEEV